MGDQTPPAAEDPPITDAAQKAQFSQRVLIKTILSRVDGGAGLAGQTVKVGGWVKTDREANNKTGLELNDGSRTNTLDIHNASINDPLWSAFCLIKDPHLIKRISLFLSTKVVF